MKIWTSSCGLPVGLTGLALMASAGGTITGCGDKHGSDITEATGATGATGGAEHGGESSTGGSVAAAGDSPGGHGNSGASSAGAAGSVEQPPPVTGLRPECAKSVPKNGDSCTIENIQCQYGTDPRRACRPVATCRSGVWSVKVGTASSCPKLAEADCSDTPAELANQRCTPGAMADSGPYCTYNDVTCACDSNTCNAGATSCAWSCDRPLPEPSCPWGQPNLGTSCTRNGLVCKYTICEDQHCVGGYWTAVDNGSCPMTPVGP